MLLPEAVELRLGPFTPGPDKRPGLLHGVLGVHVLHLLDARVFTVESALQCPLQQVGSRLGQVLPVLIEGFPVIGGEAIIIKQGDIVDPCHGFQLTRGRHQVVLRYLLQTVLTQVETLQPGLFSQPRGPPLDARPIQIQLS